MKLSESERAALRDMIARARLERQKQRDAEELAVLVRENVEGQWRNTPYESDEERTEARRKSWRESRQRIHGKCPKCGGRKAPHANVKMCWGCYSEERREQANDPASCTKCGGAVSSWRSTLCRACYRDASPAPAHGTYARYKSRRFPCRCSECCLASREYHRARREMMRGWQVAA